MPGGRGKGTQQQQRMTEREWRARQQESVEQRAEDMVTDRAEKREAMSEDPYVDPTGASIDPQKAIGKVTRGEYALYEDLYKPRIDDALTTAFDEDYVDEQADIAGDTTREVFDASTGQTDRTLSRFGGSTSDDQQQSIDRNRDLSRALAVASSENNARRTAESTQDNLLNSAQDLGTSFLSSGGSNLGSAASMAASRERAEAQAEAQEDSNDTAMAATVATIAIAAM